MATHDPSHVLFFSRGKGRGHAVPDAAIADDLRALVPGVTITFVSYSTGAATLKGLGWSVVDLDLPEDHVPWESVVRVLPILQRVEPALVVAHEEFAVVPVAKGLGVPVVYLTDWFLGADSLPMQALKHADEVVFLDEAGYQDVPAYLSRQITYVGPVLRKFPSPPQTRWECRDALGIPRRSPLVVVVPGSSALHSEALAPIADVVLDGFDALETSDKRLVWVAGDRDRERLATRCASRPDVRILKPHDAILTTMGAADVVLTKGNRITVLEAQALGIASVSISSGNNPLDDNRVCRVPTNIALRARGLTGCVLAHHLRQAIDRTVTLTGIPPDVLGLRSRLAAERLRDRLVTRPDRSPSCA
jgi:hypothetical protein